MSVIASLATLRAKAAALADAGKSLAFVPSGLREAVAGAADALNAAIDLNEAQALQLADLAQRLDTEAGTNAELLAKLGEVAERVEALEAKAG